MSAQSEGLSSCANSWSGSVAGQRSPRLLWLLAWGDARVAINKLWCSKATIDHGCLFWTHVPTSCQTRHSNGQINASGPLRALRRRLSRTFAFTDLMYALRSSLFAAVFFFGKPEGESLKKQKKTDKLWTQEGSKAPKWLAGCSTGHLRLSASG